MAGSVKLPSRPIQAIDLMRSLAILTVMAGHLKPTLPLPSPAFRWGWDHFQRVGPEGVYIFFIVSGFLITRIIDQEKGGLLQPDWKYFYVRRIARILPLFLFQILLGLVLASFLWDGSKKFVFCFKLPDPLYSASFWISLFTFSFNWASVAFSGVWHGVGHHWTLFWSLAIEEQFYLFYPVILGFLGTIQRITFLLIFVTIISFGGQIFAPELFSDISVEVTDYIGAYGEIAVGALLYLTVKRYGFYFLSHKVLSAAATVIGFLMICVVYFFDLQINQTLLIAGGVFLFLLGGIYLSFLQSRFLKVLALSGEYSYGNYLLHIMVLYFIHSFLWNLNILVAFFLYAAVTTGVAAISFHFLEKPANQLIRKAFASKESLRLK